MLVNSQFNPKNKYKTILTRRKALTEKKTNKNILFHVVLLNRVTQSRSFQLLEEWISDSEKTIAALQPSSSSAGIDYDLLIFLIFYNHEIEFIVSQNGNQLHNTNTTPRRLSSSGQTSLPSRSFRYLQEQYSVDTPLPPTNESNYSKEQPALRRGSDAHTPSRSFKFLQEQYHTSSPTTTNNRSDLMEIYNKSIC